MDSAGTPLNKFSAKRVSSQIQDSNCLKPKIESDANPTHQPTYKKISVLKKAQNCEKYPFFTLLQRSEFDSKTSKIPLKLS